LAGLAGIVIVSAFLPNWRRGHGHGERITTALIRVKSPSRCSLAHTVAFSHWPSILPFTSLSMFFIVNRLDCLSSQFNSIVITDYLSPGISLMMFSNVWEDVSSESRAKYNVSDHRDSPDSFAMQQLHDIGSLYRKVAIEALSDNVLLEIFDLYLNKNEKIDPLYAGHRGSDYPWHAMPRRCWASGQRSLLP
jgi:hypothetical protein